VRAAPSPAMRDAERRGCLHRSRPRSIVAVLVLVSRTIPMSIALSMREAHLSYCHPLPEAFLSASKDPLELEVGVAADTVAGGTNLALVGSGRVRPPGTMTVRSSWPHESRSTNPAKGRKISVGSLHGTEKRKRVVDRRCDPRLRLSAPPADGDEKAEADRPPPPPRKVENRGNSFSVPGLTSCAIRQLFVVVAVANLRAAVVVTDI